MLNIQTVGGMGSSHTLASAVVLGNPRYIRIILQ